MQLGEGSAFGDQTRPLAHHGSLVIGVERGDPLIELPDQVVGEHLIGTHPAQARARRLGWRFRIGAHAATSFWLGGSPLTASRQPRLLPGRSPGSVARMHSHVDPLWITP
jgi:hypothetical protein